MLDTFPKAVKKSRLKTFTVVSNNGKKFIQDQSSRRGRSNKACTATGGLAHNTIGGQMSKIIVTYPDRTEAYRGKIRWENDTTFSIELENKDPEETVYISLYTALSVKDVEDKE